MGKKKLFLKKSWGEKKHVSKKMLGKIGKKEEKKVHKKKLGWKKKSLGEKKTLWSKELSRIEKNKQTLSK